MSTTSKNNKEQEGARVTRDGGRLSRGKLKVCAIRDGAKLASASPDNQGTDITGGWEAASSTLQLNRAGEHIEGWLVDYDTKREQTIAGDDGGGEAFQIFDSPGYMQRLGTLHVIDRNRISLFMNSGDQHAFNRVHSQPTLSDQAVLAYPPETRTPIRRQQRQPLLTSDRARVLREFSATRIGPFIDRYHATTDTNPHQENRLRAVVLQDLDQHVGRVFSPLHPSDREKARPWAQLRLNSERYRVGDQEKTLMSWVHELLPTVRVLGNDAVPNLSQYLNLTPSSTLYHYEFVLTLGGVTSDLLIVQPPRGGSLKAGLGGGLWSGRLLVRQKDRLGAGGRIINRWSYPVVLGQVSVGIGVSIGSQSEGAVSTPFHWSAAHFPGSIKVVDLSVGIGLAFGGTGVFFGGDGTFPELATDFSGWSWNIGGGAALSEFIGLVQEPGQSAVRRYDVPVETTPAASARITNSIHFPFGESLLTREARQMLRVLSAQELALFRSNEASLVIASHADRVDTECYNEILTRLRSLNCLQALQDILGPNFRVPYFRTLGLGESGATTAGDADDTKNPFWRRSDVYLNGRLHVQLRGE